MVPTDPTSISPADQDKLIAVYERLCPDDVLLDDDPRRPAIAAEIYDVGVAKSTEDALKVIEWWRQPEGWAKRFVMSVRRAVVHMKLNRT